MMAATHIRGNLSGYISCAGRIIYKRVCPSGLKRSENEKYCDCHINLKNF